MLRKIGSLTFCSCFCSEFEAERKQNASEIEQSHGHFVCYGRIIQLMHMKSPPESSPAPPINLSLAAPAITLSLVVPPMYLPLAFPDMDLFECFGADHPST